MCVSASHFPQAHQLRSIEKVIDESLSLVMSLRHRVWAEAGMQRNRQALVNSLPPETLCRVFELVQGDNSWPEPSSGLVFRWHLPNVKRIRKCNKWIRVTAVCRLWREIALGDPFLWNTIYIQRTSHPEYYLEWIRRSGGLPLHLLIHDFAYAQRQFAKELPSWCTRLRRLYIPDVRRLDQLEALSGVAPQLQSLAIVYKGAGQPPISTLFSDHTPNLRRISLCNVSQPIQHAFANLAHLALQSPRWTTIDDLVRLLHANPRLESLILCTVYFWDRPGPAVEDQAVIQLPALRRLAFKACDTRILRTIFSRVELPADDVAIVCDGWYSSYTPIDQVLNSPCQRTHIPPLLGVRALSVSDRRRMTILAASDSSALGMCGALTTFQGRATVPDLHTFMELHALQELRIVGGSSRSEAWWKDTLNGMPSLTKVVFVRSHPEVLRMLFDHINIACPVPSLHTLVLITHPFNPEWDYVDHLSDVLSYRHSQGHRIRTLQVVCEGTYAKVSPRFSTQTFDALQRVRDVFEKYVDEVRFDLLPDDTYYPALQFPGACQTWMDEAHL